MLAERFAIRFLLLLASCVLASTPSARGAEFNLQTTNSSVIVRDGELRIAEFVFDHPKTLRPFLAHVMTPGGIQVTRNFPPVQGMDAVDHEDMHPGVWLAFGDVNGEDIWRNRATLVHRRFVTAPTVQPEQIAFETESDLMTEKGKRLGSMRTKIFLTARPCGYLWIWQASLIANEAPMRLGDQEEMGLGVRLATSIIEKNGGAIVNSEGLTTAKGTWGRTASWADNSGVVNGERVGVLLMPSPDHFRESWFHNRDYGLMVANPFGNHAFTQGEKSSIEVPKDHPLRLCFGILVHASRESDPIDLNQEHEFFLNLLEGPLIP